MIDNEQIERLSINHYSNLNLKANPFAYLNDEELLQTTEPRIELEAIAKQIMSSASCFIQLYGNKGLGKSTHLQSLYYNYFPDAIYYKLKKKEVKFIKKIPEILIIDSFQLLPIKNRIQLLNNQRHLIVASHYSHNFLNYKKRDFNKEINFNKLTLNMELLQRIVTNKIEFVRINTTKPVPKIKKVYLQNLLRLYGNNLREIQKELYQAFTGLNQDIYEL